LTESSLSRSLIRALPIDSDTIQVTAGGRVGGRGRRQYLPTRGKEQIPLMSQNRLSVRAVSSKKRRGRYSDGDGLVLQISKWGSKSWIFRYQRDRRERHMGLGSHNTVTLAMAREAARKCRHVLLEGRDPIDQRNAELQQRRLEAARHVTFRECAEAYLTAHQAGWRNEKHRAQWSSTLAAYAYPVIGELPVSAVDTTVVLKCLEPIWRRKPETANRLRGRIESVLNWAAVRRTTHLLHPKNCERRLHTVEIASRYNSLGVDWKV
jgi:integrase-like protein/Arm domain-containing DNA-binding protein